MQNDRYFDTIRVACAEAVVSVSGFHCSLLLFTYRILVSETIVQR